MRILLILVYYFLALNVSGQEKEYVTVTKATNLMGSRFDITIVDLNEELGYISIDEAIAEVTRIDKMLSSWDENSETSQINKNAGIKPVKVSLELYGLIERSKQFSEITDGAFDISYAAIDDIWKFDGSMKEMPSEAEIKRSIRNIGYQKIILNDKEQSVFLMQKGMKISFGGIGKGYAADKAKALLVSKQVRAGIIDASGDLTTWGTKANGEKWIIGIANPMSKDKIFSWLPVVESSVATSGNTEKYVVIDSKKYGHIIDPRTGYPAMGINSVSIFAKNAEQCDAFATAVFILGREKGISLINQFGDIKVFIVDSENKIHKSDGLLFESD